MKLDFGHTQLNIAKGGAVEVNYKVTQRMIAAAMVEAQRLGIAASKSDLEKILHATQRVA
jgi:hypothetical protein